MSVDIPTASELENALLKTGITSQQMEILALFEKTGVISQITLSDSMNIDQVSMVQFLNAQTGIKFGSISCG